MSVRKIGFVGFRSPDLDGFRSILEQGLGLTPVECAEDQVSYNLDDGTRLEGYSEVNPFHAFFTTGPVIGFEVDDFEKGWANLKDLGVIALTEVQSEKGRAWVHFRLPDGTIAELIGGTGVTNLGSKTAE